MRSLPYVAATDAGTLYIDVCNGDADGLCAIRQLRLAEPREAVLVTGLKREIGLLARVSPRPGLVVDVCDIALERNRDALAALLAAGARVRYFDHHLPGPLPAHPALELHIDTASDRCTSAIVDAHLGGRFRRWAVTGAFGDNLGATAGRLAAAAGLRDAERDALRTLGEAINYNAYGEADDDVLIAPAALYAILAEVDDPLALAGDARVRALVDRRAEDLAAAESAPVRRVGGADLVVLPDTPWSRRVSGSYAHARASRHPDHAQAVLRPNRDGSYNVSLRAPVARPHGAGEFCRSFGAGGGRDGAGGIDRLAAAALPAFEQALARAWP